MDERIEMFNEICSPEKQSLAIIDCVTTLIEKIDKYENVSDIRDMQE